MQHKIAGKNPTNLKAHLNTKHPHELAELAKTDAEKEKTVEFVKFRLLLPELDERYPVPDHATITNEKLLTLV